MQFDIIIVGAGPAGLSLVRSLAGCGLSIAIIEQQERETLADPAYDGREIALHPQIGPGVGRTGRLGENAGASIVSIDESTGPQWFIPAGAVV